jgi:hypothetical protein
MEAYASVYTQSEEQEVLSEDFHSAVKYGLKKGSEFMKKNPVGKAISGALKPSGGPRKDQLMLQKRRPQTPLGRLVADRTQGMLNQDVDVFDLIKGHLLDEGYADTEESALVIMANMSEDWRQSIVEDFPAVRSSPRAGDAGTRGLTKTPTGYINRYSRGEDLPPGTVNKIMGGDLMVKKQGPKSDIKTA